MKTLRIEVAQEDIQGGLPDSPDDCPIARAVRRAYPDFRFVYVGEDFIGLRRAPCELHQSEHIDLPEIACRFIRDFDERAEVKPISFEVLIHNAET